MEPDLPIIRLTRTSDQNVRLARDPLDASMTFYTFLRSLPSHAEQQHAMEDLRRHATGYYRDSHAAFSSFGQREATLQQLEAAVFDGLLRYPPAVSPSWCRAHRAECLAPLLTRAHAEPDRDTATPILSPMTTPGNSPPARADEPLHDDERGITNVRVAARELKQFTDPYSLYEQTRQGRRASQLSAPTEFNTSVALSSVAADRTAHNDEDNSDEDQDVARRHDTPVDERAEQTPLEHHLQRSGTQRPQDVRRASPVAVATDDDASSEKDASLSTLEETSRFVAAATIPGPSDHHQPAAAAAEAPSTAHPIMTLLLSQVRQMNERDAREGGDGAAAMDATDAAFSAAMYAKLDGTAQHLADAKASLADAAAQNDEARSIWCTSHTHYKAAESYLDELQKRLGAAHRLFDAQRTEQGTVQAAHVAVALEATTLRLLLRDVERCMDDAADRLEHITARPPELLELQVRQEAQVDMALLVDLRRILATGSTGTQQ